MTTSVPIPPTLGQAIVDELGAEALSRWGLEALVLEGVREGMLSTGEAGELLGMGYFETEGFLKAKGVPLLLSTEEFERDQADLREIMALSRRR